MSGAASRIEVAAALVFREDKLLIAQRYQQSHLGGLWEFPGGKREPGEGWTDCLVRELREELGIEVDVGLLVYEVTHSYAEKTVHLKFFRCEWLRNEPVALGCPDFRWITRPELDDFQFPEADAGLVRLIQSEAFKWSGRGIE